MLGIMCVVHQVGEGEKERMHVSVCAFCVAVFQVATLKAFIYE